MPIDYVLAAVSSIAVWCWIGVRLGRGRPLLRYESRRVVPWGPIGLIIAVGLLSLKVAALAGSAIVADVDVSRFIWQAVAMSVGFLLATFVTGVALVFICRADRHDLGMPSSWAQFWADVGVGVVAAVAAILPVYAVKASLLYLTPQPSQHPLLEKLAENPTGGLAAVVVFSAVFVAPVFEEFLYRLLLQGWLEKIECPVPAQPYESADNATPEVPLDSQPWPELERGEHDESPYASPRTATLPDVRPQIDEELARQTTTTGMPVGAMAIGISAVLFALAHLGHGLDPIPLLILGIIFGYVYHRTHRLVPCIVAHMSFNAFSLTMFWIELAWRS